MNQRVANMKPATMRDSGVSMSELRFLKNCVEQLSASGKDEAAFYFEQLIDFLQEGGSLKESNDAAWVLGL